MHTDPVADMIIRIKNGYGGHLKSVSIPWSKPKESLAQVLRKSGYLSSVEVKEVDGKKEILVVLKYDGKEASISEVKRVSKPSLRIYVDKKHLPKVLGGMGIAIISTPKGLMTDKEARNQGLGGEVWCEVW